MLLKKKKTIRHAKVCYTRKCVGAFVLLLCCLLLLTTTAHANNISVSNTVLQNQDVPNSTVEVKFDLAWQNPFSGTDSNGAAFHDRAWIFVKYWVVGVDSETTGWHHATLVSGGMVTPVSDGKGAIANIGAAQTVKWNYVQDGVSVGADVRVKVCAMEMVYIPEGAFVYNADGIGGFAQNNYGADAQITVSSTGDIPEGAAASWPNGYSAFYVMKYEVSQGQYADFLNMLSAGNAAVRYTGSYNSYRQSVSNTGTPYGSKYAADFPSRGQNYLSWDDCKAYASWCGLRPLTEMEFEKAGRGGGTANTNLYPWGDTAPTTTTYTFDGATLSQYYACYNNTSGGPVNVGLYLSGDLGRTEAQTGASIYGVADLAGNLWEHLINCASLTAPANGDGGITPPAAWPPASAGKGIRGGSWYYAPAHLRVSARYGAGAADTGRSYNYGFRAARTQ